MTGKKVEKRKNKIKFILLIFLIVLVLVAIGIAGCILIKHNTYKKYEKYEKKMDMYGFSQLYDNKSPKSSQLVSKSEAMKLVIGATLNVSDMSNLTLTDKTYKDAIWIEYAKDRVIFKDNAINEKNVNKKVKYIDIVEYLANSKAKILDIELSRNTEPKMKDYKKYDKNKQRSIMDMVSNEIIENTEKNLNGKRNIAKGELNELIVKFVEKYNIISNGQPIVTDPAKLPSNASDYPYIVEGVDKQVYEQAFSVVYEPNFKTPYTSYKIIKANISQIKNMVEEYYDTILNIDYNTINKDTLKFTLDEISIFKVGVTTLDEYINYVKDNKIQITGKSTVQLPAIYKDGYFTSVRVKLEFEIKNTNNNKNILFMDLTNSKENKVYDKNKYCIYIDTKMSNSAFSKSLFIENGIVCELVLDMSKDEIKLEKVGE